MQIQKKNLLLLLITSAFMACTKDDEKNDTPVSDPRSIVIGNWICNEESEVFLSTTYPVVIFAHSTIANRIVISNFYNLGAQQSNCQMEISGTSFTIFQQNISGYDIVGSGILENSSTIKLSYTTNDGAGIDNVTAVYTKTN